MIKSDNEFNSFFLKEDGTIDVKFKVNGSEVEITKAISTLMKSMNSDEHIHPNLEVEKIFFHTSSWAQELQEQIEKVRSEFNDTLDELVQMRNQ